MVRQITNSSIVRDACLKITSIRHPLSGKCFLNRTRLASRKFPNEPVNEWMQYNSCVAFTVDKQHAKWSRTKALTLRVSQHIVTENKTLQTLTDHFCSRFYSPLIFFNYFNDRNADAPLFKFVCFCWNLLYRTESCVVCSKRLRLIRINYQWKCWSYQIFFLLGSTFLQHSHSRFCSVFGGHAIRISQMLEHD